MLQSLLLAKAWVWHNRCCCLCVGIFPYLSCWYQRVAEWGMTLYDRSDWLVNFPPALDMQLLDWMSTFHWCIAKRNLICDISQFIGDMKSRLLDQFTSIHIEDKAELSTEFDFVARKLSTIHIVNFFTGINNVIALIMYCSKMWYSACDWPTDLAYKSCSPVGLSLWGSVSNSV